jgi:hypothetical protein
VLRSRFAGSSTLLSLRQSPTFAAVRSGSAGRSKATRRRAATRSAWLVRPPTTARQVKHNTDRGDGGHTDASRQVVAADDLAVDYKPIRRSQRATDRSDESDESSSQTSDRRFQLTSSEDSSPATTTLLSRTSPAREPARRPRLPHCPPATIGFL